MTIAEIQKFLDQSETSVPMWEIQFPAEESGSPIILNGSAQEAEELASALGRALGYSRATLRYATHPKTFLI